MTTLKTPEQVADNLEYIISNPEQGSGSTAQDVIKYITQDRQQTADVLCALLEGLPSMDVDEYVAIIKAGNWDKMYEAGVKASQKQAQDIIRATLSK